MRRRSNGQSRRRRLPQPPRPELVPVQPPARTPLPEMDEAELIAWLREQQSELESFCSFAQGWRISRNRRGLHTETDDRYDRFLPAAADLIAGLAEWRAAIEEEQAKEEEKQ